MIYPINYPPVQPTNSPFQPQDHDHTDIYASIRKRQIEGDGGSTQLSNSQESEFIPKLCNRRL